VLLLI